MRSKLFKTLICLTLSAAIFLLAAFNVLLIWVATGPRTLNSLTPYIEQTLSATDGSYSVKIGETGLIWDGWRHPIDIRLKHVNVLTRDGQLFSRFPEISLGVDLLSLPLGRVLPTSITITHPVMSLFQNEDRSISFGFRKEPEAPGTPAPAFTETTGEIPFAALLAPLLSTDSNSNLRKLRYIYIHNAAVSIGNTGKGVFFEANGTEIGVMRDYHGKITVGVDTQISYEDYASSVKANFTTDKESTTIDGALTFTQLMPSTLAKLFADNAILNGIKLPLSGQASISLDMKGSVQKLHFAIDGGLGSIASDKLEAPIPVTSMHVEGLLSNNFNDIQIDNFQAILDGAQLSGNGVVSLSNNDAAVRATITGQHIPADQVHLFWPPGVSPMSREWVLSNITKGIVPKAEAHIDIHFGELAQPALPKADIDASIDLEGASIRYLPGHPDATNVKGTIHIDGISLNADITSADYMDATKLSNGKVTIDDLKADNPYIKVEFDAASSARNIVRFLGLPRLKHAARLGLKEDQVQGSATAHATVGFNFFAPKDANGKPTEPDVDFTVKGDVKDITEPGFMSKFDIYNATGSFYVDSKYIEFKGRGEVNGASLSQAEVKYLFQPENSFDTFLSFTGTAPTTSFARFGYPSFDFLSGALGVTAKLKIGDKAEEVQASFDFTNTDIMLKDFSWHKPAQEPASLEFTSERKSGVSSISSFTLKGKDMQAHGSAELKSDLSALQRVTLDKLDYGKTDLKRVNYEVIPGGYKIEATGASADLSAWLEGDPNSTGNFSFAHFPALIMKLDIARLILSKDDDMTAVKGEVNCDASICNSANIAAKMPGGKPFSFRILRNPKGQRQFSLHAEDAGAFLKATNIFDGMVGGDLTITGNYDDSGSSSVLSGRADINEHLVKKAPILAEILSLASLTGIFDTLQGNGIRFTRLIIPFTLNNDVITIKKGKTYGPSIGLTADGTMTFPKHELNLQGTVVPAYSVNSVLGKVPLVGRVLTGGEGQGVFAARFSVRGTDKKPEVTVNPLAILTPGFLRGVFDIMDAPAKKPDEPGKDKKSDDDTQ